MWLYAVLPIFVYSGVLTNTDRIAILEVFNQARCDLYAPPPASMPPMYWDTGLEAIAQTYVDSCPSASVSITCGTPPPTPCTTFQQYGSLFYGSPKPGVLTAAQIAHFWVSDGYGWQYGTWGTTGSGAEVCPNNCDPYTQIINANTARVGCAMSSLNCTGPSCASPLTCCNLNITGCDICEAQFACFFDPKGNVQGQAPYVSGVSKANAVPSQACLYSNETAVLRSLPTGACAVALPKKLNSTCTLTINSTQTCEVFCEKGYVPVLRNTSNVTASCSAGVLSPPLATLALCTAYTGGSSSVAVSLFALLCAFTQIY